MHGAPEPAPRDPRREPVDRTLFRVGSAVALGLLVSALGGCLVAEHGVAALRGAQPQQELVLDLPPVDLPARSAHGAHPQPEPLWVVWPVDAWLQGFTVEVVDGHGRPLPEVVLHHVKIITPGKRELFAPIMLRVVGAGSETRGGSLPHTFGVPIQAGDSLLATAMVHDPEGRAYAGVRVRVRLLYRAGAGASSIMTVYPFFLHDRPPGGETGYDLPPGRSERSWEAQPAVSGRVIGLGGHIHRYGTELRLEDVAAGRVLWRARIRTDSAGDVVSVSRSIYRWGRGIALDANRAYRVTAVYENPTSDTLWGAGMGAIGGVFRPAGMWPAVDRQDALYVLDRRREEAPAAGPHSSPSPH